MTRSITALHGQLSRAELQRMADAGARAVDCMRVLAKSGSNLVAEVLRGQGEFTELEHYPPDDVYDPETHAQYYFHAHPPEGRPRADYGHFHLFLRPDGTPGHVRPASGAGLAPPAGERAGPCHLVAISMTRDGLPERLFTTNRWVTAETWHSASAAIDMLDRFVVDLSYPSWPLNQWLTAMMVLFRPQVATLLIERDRVIDAWRSDHPTIDVFEDRRLEITSAVDISLREQLEWLDEALDEGVER